MSDPAIPMRRARENRRARARTPPAKYLYIRRQLRPVELLSPEAVAIIEANAETILEEIGIELRREPESLRLWRQAGAEDLQNFIKLAHMAPAIHFSGGSMCEPMEIPPNKRHLDVQ